MSHIAKSIPAVHFFFLASLVSIWYLASFFAAGNGAMERKLWLFPHKNEDELKHHVKPTLSTVMSFSFPLYSDKWRMNKHHASTIGKHKIKHTHQAETLLGANGEQIYLKQTHSFPLTEALKHFNKKVQKQVILEGRIQSVAKNGKWNIALQNIDPKFSAIDMIVQAKINISDPAFFNHFIRTTMQFSLQNAELIGGKQLSLSLLSAHSILECEKRHAIYQKYLLQDSEQANLLDWTKRYTANVLAFDDKFAFVEVAATNLVGIIAMKELPFFIHEGSTILARVSRLSPLVKINFPKYFDASWALKRRETHLSNPKSIILSTEASVHHVKVLSQLRKNVEKQPIQGLLTEARYRRERKDDLLEDELLSILGKKYYAKLQQERKDRFYGVNEGLDEELAHFQSDYPIDLAGWFGDESNNHTVDDVTTYISNLQKNQDILKTLDLEEILRKMNLMKQQLALLPIAPNSKLERLRKALNGEALLSKEAVENYPGLGSQTKRALLKILVNRVDPIKALQGLIAEQKSKLPVKVNKLIEKHRHAEIIEPPKLPPKNAAPELQSGRSMRNSSLPIDKTPVPVSLDHPSYARVKKYDTALRMALQNKTKVAINHNEDYTYLNEHEDVQLPKSLQHQGNIDNLLHIPIPE